MKKLVMLLLLVFLVSGCVHKVWVYPEGATIADFERDKAQCIYEAKLNTPKSNAYVPPAPKDKYGISGDYFRSPLCGRPGLDHLFLAQLDKGSAQTMTLRSL